MKISSLQHFTHSQAAKMLVLCISAVCAMLAPLTAKTSKVQQTSGNHFPGWPQRYEGRPLTQLSLTPREKGFMQNFPGKIARFSDGHREIIIRWVTQPTRMLHPAADCFRGVGYTVTPVPMQINQANIKMGCFAAEKGQHNLSVCEYIRGSDEQSWSDISSWYWSALMTDEQSGWWSFVVAQNNQPPVF